MQSPTLVGYHAPSSSSRPHDPKQGDWEKCSVSHDQLVKLQTQGFLPPADLVPVQAGLDCFNGEIQAEEFPNPSGGERVCFVPYLLRGVGFPIHPFLRGLLEYYGLQLHNFTPASILHIVVTSLYANYSWVSRLISSCGGSCSALSRATMRGQYFKWA